MLNCTWSSCKPVVENTLYNAMQQNANKFTKRKLFDSRPNSQEEKIIHSTGTAQKYNGVMNYKKVNKYR